MNFFSEIGKKKQPFLGEVNSSVWNMLSVRCLQVIRLVAGIRLGS